MLQLRHLSVRPFAAIMPSCSAFFESELVMQPVDTPQYASNPHCLGLGASVLASKFG